jgi:putative photosynthetic complex assembly protein 2
MTQYVFPVLFTLVIWWLSTGIVLAVINRGRATYSWSMFAATGVLFASLFGLNWSSTGASVFSNYVAFSCGILIWGWVEMSYYTGLITGPRPEPCPPGVSSWRRFSLGIQASLYHELTILALVGLLFALTWGASNTLGAWTFVVLWLMRWSVKLNIFLGVPNLNLQFFPHHLRYLETFIVKRRMNVLFPISMVASSAAALFILQGAVADGATSTQVAASLLLGTLVLLAMLEHVFLVLRLPDAVLWNWALGEKSGASNGHDDIQKETPKTRARPASRPLSKRSVTVLDTVQACESSSP